MIWIDTSAFIAILNREDQAHISAKRVFTELLDIDAPMVTSNYCVVETFALLQRRVGSDGVRLFAQNMMPLVSVLFVQESEHQVAMGATFESTRRGPSLVDHVSFEIMRRRGITQAFTLDKHFADRGFKTVP